MRFRFLSLFILACQSGIAWANANQDLSLTWISDTMLDMQISQEKSFELNADTFKILSRDLPQSSVTIINANQQRADLLLDTSSNACIGNKIKTPTRQEKYLFTALPQTIFPNQRLYVNNDSLISFLNENIKEEFGQAISMNQLFNSQQKFILGVIKGRSFGQALDNLIANAPNNIQIWQRAGDGLSLGIMDMFMHHRIDAIIEYPSVYEHYGIQLEKQISGVKSYAIDEVNNVVSGYIMCVDTDMGKKLINYFDQQLAKQTLTQQYLNVHLGWFKHSSPEHITELYNQAYKTQF